MELDELKKSWNRLDDRLKAAPITDEKQIADMVEQCRKNTHHHLHSLSSFLRWSLYGGGLVLLSVLAAGCWYSHRIDTPEQLVKHYMLLAFITVTFITAVMWDRYTYRQVKQIEVDTMTVADVIHRIRKFRRNLRWEVWSVGIWMLLLTVLYYWYNNLSQTSPAMQVVTVGLILLTDVVLVLILYRRLVYRPLKHAGENLDQLQELCSGEEHP